jgi:hypothetical protein
MYLIDGAKTTGNVAIFVLRRSKTPFAVRVWQACHNEMMVHVGFWGTGFCTVVRYGGG